jgi:hypothetical protein
MRSVIGEWFSPDFHLSLYRPLLLTWLLLLTTLAWSRLVLKWRVLVPLLLTSFAALDAVRHIPIFVLVAIPVIAAALPAAAAATGVSRSRPFVSRFRPVFNVAVIVLMALLAGVKWVTLTRNQSAREAELFPRSAVAFLLANSDPQRVFVYYDWGGYAIWKLYPQYRVFVDGRADLYGDDLLRQFETAVLLQAGWKDVLDRWQVETVLVPPSCALAQALMLDPGWRSAYADSQSAVFLRARPGAESTAISHIAVARGTTK